MNADRLLEHYERIADAPDAIARLRRFILDLAVRGKLVPQDASDEPASELLKRIAKEKARLAKAGEIKDKSLPPVDEDAEFDVPPTWRWTRLGTVTSYIQRGKSPKYAASEGSLVVSQKCVQWRGLDLSVAKQITVESLADYEDIRFLRDGDLLWNSTGTGTIGRIIRLVEPPEKLVCDSHVTVVRCLEVEPEYIRIWLRSDHVFELIEGRAAGSTNQVELTAQMAINQVVPLPPLAEQYRIVAKVDELMALCDRLEAARAGREAARDRLAAASLARLNAPDPESFQADARFALHALPALTARPDQIKALRQTILNLAVRGKLVPQDANDEPASELLKGIAADKAERAISARDRRATKIRQLVGDGVPFPLPSNWVWASFGDITISRDGERIPVSREDREQRAKVYDYYGASGVIDKIDGFLFDKPLLLIGEDGANLINRSTPIAFIARGKYWVNNHAHVLDGLSEGFLRYVELFINAIDLKPYVTGTAQPKMNQAKMNSIPVALPPLAEQHRIVAKIDALMALCDRLEASLTATAATRRRLLDALLAEALAPADDRELEAAE
mgnify:CR=1 FL=1